MGVRKFRSVEQMPGRPNRPRLDPENLRLAFGLSSIANGLNPVRLVPGTARYRSWDDSKTARGKPLQRRPAESHAESYRRLEEMVERSIPEGVTYYPRGNEIEDGYFSPAPFDVPPARIVIYRPRHQDEPGDVLHELLTLAHEFGHFRSYERGLRGSEYEQAIKEPWTAWPRLSTSARHSILEEERRAWQSAREILAQVGFADWETFWDRHQAALADYRARLQLDR